MVENTRGLVLRTRPLTETSLIVSWLTFDAGRISTVAKGALRPKSPFRGKLDLFYLADLTFKRSRRSELHTLCELSLIATHPRLRCDLAALRQASYCAALLEQTTERDTPLPGILEMVLGFLGSFANNTAEDPSGALGESAPPPGDLAPNPQRVFALELRLLNELGLAPDFQANRISAETLELIGRLQTLSWAGISDMQVAPSQAVELRRFLHGFLILNFGRLARGRDAAVAGSY